MGELNGLTGYEMRKGNDRELGASLNIANNRKTTGDQGPSVYTLVIDSQNTRLKGNCLTKLK